MSLGPGGSHRIEVGTSVRVDPRVVLGSQILQMNQQQLEQAIDAELVDNPALERLEAEPEAVADEAIMRVVAPQELGPDSGDHEYRRSLPADDGETTWIDFASSHTPLSDRLRAQLTPMLPENLWDLGNYVIGCLNDKGYLETPNEEIALDSGTSIQDVEAVVKLLHRCEPLGVGARTLQECLLIQLRAESSLEAKLAKSIVKSYMDEFVARKTARISRKFDVLPSVVGEAFKLILTLSPYPAEAHGAYSGGSTPARSVAIVPDLAIRRDDDGWHVDVRGPDPTSLTVDRIYRKRNDELERMERPPKDEKRHISTFVQRAATFIQCIEQRRQTMKRIGEYLIKNQSGFLATGQYQFLRSLTKAQLAADLELHESTISRATQGKFVAIPAGEVVPFEVFFKPALRIQRIIEEILQLENPANPLSDQAIAEMLAERGIVVARRTVNKYRDRKKLLSSRKRRSA